MLEGFWTDRRVRHLMEMAGTSGKSAGEPLIVSMGSTGPPNVEEPIFIRDHLVCDGAQVTRPSIDPYREPVDTQVYLPGLGIRLSQPLIFTVHQTYPPEFRRAAVRAAYNLGLLAYIYGEAVLEPDLHGYSERVLLDYMHGEMGEYLVLVGSGQNIGELAKILKITSSTDPRLLESLGWGDIAGVLVDEDHETPIEVATSLVDKELRKLRYDGKPLRDHATLLSSSRRVRGADDIFKLLALGADAVAISDAALIASGCVDDAIPENVIYERLENLALALQKEVKLLAGAAGVSRLFTSLVGNRELLRAIGLSADVRYKLGVRQAGVG